MALWSDEWLAAATMQRRDWNFGMTSLRLLETGIRDSGACCG
jgi:hypothetical protein